MNVWVNVETLRQSHLARSIVGTGLRFMHVACDAAESHHHILSYLKIDLPAIVCVCALVVRHRPGGCLLPFIHALISPHTPRFPSCGAAV